MESLEHVRELLALFAHFLQDCAHVLREFAIFRTVAEQILEKGHRTLPENADRSASRVPPDLAA
jgi:hypothetical protein